MCIILTGVCIFSVKRQIRLLTCIWTLLISDWKRINQLNFSAWLPKPLEPEHLLLLRTVHSVRTCHIANVADEELHDVDDELIRDAVGNLIPHISRTLLAFRMFQLRALM